MKALIRIGLGIFLCFTGTAHFRITESFIAQVPQFMPEPKWIIYISGVIEIFIGLGLILLKNYRKQVGLCAALFFIVIFPGNISQYLTHSSAFGLDTDFARGMRLLFQPVLIVAALWSTNINKKI